MQTKGDFTMGIRDLRIAKFKVVLLALALFSLVGCYKQEVVRGPEYDMFVFAEESDWQQLEPVLSEVFQQTIMTPQPESHFNLIHVNADTMGIYLARLARKHLLFVSTLESEGDIADIVMQSIDKPEQKEKVRRGESFLFKKHDQWGRNQLILIMVSSSIPKLTELIQENRDFIYNMVLEHQQTVVKELMYDRLENKELSSELLEKYDWSVRIQHDYFLALEDSIDNFVFLRRRHPERWLFVKWFDGLDPSVISKDWYFDMRDSIGVWYYGGDTVNRTYTDAEPVDFKGRWCLKIEGLWENDEKVAGGPLLAYVFYDEPTRRTYIIDCSVFSPNRLKIPYLDQLNVMANTFRTQVDFQREEAGG